jgi:hypothetical protein
MQVSHPSESVEVAASATAVMMIKPTGTRLAAVYQQQDFPCLLARTGAMCSGGGADRK